MVVDVLRYSDIGESRHATTNRYKHKPYCTCVLSCTYSTFRDVIRLIIRVLSSRGSFISNRLWAKLTSLCCILCLSVFTLSHSESSESSGVFQCFCAHLSFYRWGTICAFEVICIESIFALYLSFVGLVELLLLALHPIFVSVVLRFISTQAHPLFCWWEDHQTLHWLIFILSPSPPLFTAPFDVFSYQPLTVPSFVILSWHPFCIIPTRPPSSFAVRIWRVLDCNFRWLIWFGRSGLKIKQGGGI